MKKLSILYCAYAVMLLSSCANIFDDAEYVEDVKLGAKVKSVECLAEYGECSFDIVSNCTYSARIIKGTEWLSFTGEDVSDIQMKGDATLALSFTSNRGYRRCGVLVLSSGHRRDTLTVKQEGLYRQSIETDLNALEVPGEGGNYSVSIRTNLISKDFKFETVDSKDFPVIGKVDNYDFSDNTFTFRVLPSDSRDTKTFITRIYTVDEWGEKVSGNIVITQKPGRR